MKKNILSAISVSTLLFLVACSNGTTSDEANVNFDTTKLKAGEAYYTCPMHPEVLSDKPATCPKCGGMELEKAEKKI